MSFYVYILYSVQLDRYYIGSPKNLEERLERHLQSNKGFTSKTKDWQVCYSENFESRIEAIQRERQIKNWKSRKMIKALILSRNNT